jgi:LuxR family transcriptional regulator, maltose regulon positive regulatory protein
MSTVRSPWPSHRSPINLRLVIATRWDAPLPLTPFRAAGELTELRTDELRLSVREAHSLLNGVLGLELSDHEVEALWQRTEGWAAGLYLFALSAAGCPETRTLITGFAKGNRHIVDYLSDEVLKDQDPDLLGFLYPHPYWSGSAVKCAMRYWVPPSRQQLWCRSRRAISF